MTIKQFNSTAGYSIGGDPSPIEVIDANANVTANTLTVNSSANVIGNIMVGNSNLGNLAIANFFQGDGGLLTNIAVSAGTAITNGNSNVSVAFNGNVTVAVNGTATVLTVSDSGANVSGHVTSTNYISTANNLIASGIVIAGAVSYANIDGTAGQVLTTYGNGITYWSAASGGGVTTGKAIAMAMIFG